MFFFFHNQHMYNGGWCCERPVQYLSNPAVDVQRLQGLGDLKGLMRKLQCLKKKKHSHMSTREASAKGNNSSYQSPNTHLYVVLLQIQATEVGPSNNILWRNMRVRWEYCGRTTISEQTNQQHIHLVPAEWTWWSNVEPEQSSQDLKGK